MCIRDRTTTVKFINDLAEPSPSPSPSPTVPPTPTPTPTPSVQPGNSSAVRTGDDARLSLYAVLFGLSAAGITVTLASAKRRGKRGKFSR